MLFRFLTLELESALKSAVSPLAVYLKMLLIGAILVGLALGLLGLGVMLVAVGIFVELAETSSLSAAAFWTAGGLGVVGVIVLLIGLSNLRRPR